MRKTGYYEDKYFIPYPLPPKDPSFVLSEESTALYGDVMLSLGKLNEMTNNVPDIQRFIKAYVTKEALLSCAIEGIHTTLYDVFTQPLLESKPNKETQLVMNYSKALYSAMNLTRQEGLPICSRVLLNAHKILMEYGEGDSANPGHYRKQAVRVGSLIPPPPLQIPALMSDLENYINTDETLPPLIKAGLVHVQFETIHPFLDGNGRIGRLLIVLMLLESKLLEEPLLYPSLYFKKNQLEYYQRLDGVRTRGDFEGWIHFYLNVMKQSSDDAYQRGKTLETLKKECATKIVDHIKSENIQQKRLKALEVIFLFPVISIKELGSQLKVSYNSADQIINEFVSLGLLTEETNQKRGKLFSFKAYLAILNQDYF